MSEVPLYALAGRDFGPVSLKLLYPDLSTFTPKP